MAQFQNWRSDAAHLHSPTPHEYDRRIRDLVSSFKHLRSSNALDTVDLNVI